ncbi:thiamine pyrophosphate-dependent enzyme [Fusibacter tunisiensis]|uniref:Indolepyruvate oxidoreductase subunit IorA n=1 Tax=Fusibacter tunisiensis TaxID=1008308 RepID=A0ABS2MRN7_9FIRM|nr:indolepyruvate ferredoxin oxidoreductase alpha subunit [Fusibacter tunisiensis]
MEKILMTGNQAIARGFYEAGGHLAASYPGSPTVEMVETLKAAYPDIYSEFSLNEKVALEVGIGASFAGARTLVAMKHVGVNIAADPLMTFTQTRIKGGFLLMSGDDPGMASSQNEQDNRLFAKFANMPILDPSNSQEAKDMVGLGLEISETYETPVMLRITSRLCHSRSLVTLGEKVSKEIEGFKRDVQNFGMIPPNTFDKQYHMQNRIDKLKANLNQFGINTHFPHEGADVLIVTSGIVFENVKELNPRAGILKLGMVWPIDPSWLKEIASHYNRIVVIEEMMPFIENELKLAGISCEGKSLFSFTGELDVKEVYEGLAKVGVVDSIDLNIVDSGDVMGRLPMFCAGCPHRPVFDILKKAKRTVIGDIGCYSMGILYPLEVLDTVISMGASLGIVKGMTKAHKIAGKQEPLVAVIGDGTFYHSGMTGMMNLLHQLEPDDNMTVIILNNGTTAMTGGQPNASSSPYGDGSDMAVDMPKLLEVMGITRVQVVDQFNYKEAKKVIEAEISHPGLGVVITTRPCALKYKIKSPHFYVDPEICIGCRTCVKTNCPPIHMKAYEGIEKLKSSIDPAMCVGCSVCSQVCPVGAIKLSSLQERGDR